MAAMTESCVPHDDIESVPFLEAGTDTDVRPGEDLETLEEHPIEAEALVETERGEKQEEVELDIQTACPPIKDDSTTAEAKNWKPGSRCRAVYSEDGLVYPAVILWIKDQRCRVRYDEYNNEEEMDVSSLLHPNELHGPCRAAGATKGYSLRFNPGSSKSDWKRSRRDESKGDRGGERGTQMKKGAGNQSKIDEEAAEKRNFTNFFPPFTPPRIGSMDPLSSIPSPPPWTFFENDKGDCLDVNAITNMLMMWYMCGFHTGSYLAQQKSKSSSKD